MAGKTTTLTEALPRACFSERHSLNIDAPREQVWEALISLQWDDLRFTKPLMLLRGLGRTREAANLRVLDGGPVELMHREPPRYVAAAAIGRPWKLAPERGPKTEGLQGILDFDEPRWLKYGMDFTLESLASGQTRIVTTTLCEPTDESARRRFRPYWLLIRPFSGLIRRDMLHAIARRARPPARTSTAPGQRVLIGPAPRFGLPKYLRTPFTIPPDPVLKVTDSTGRTFILDREDLNQLPETTKDLDLHCVMTWSTEGTRWTGWRFTDLWTELLERHADPSTVEMVFAGLDGASSSVPLVELLRDDVILAHARHGEPLARDHGAPYRLVVPHLYGYMQIKHVCRIDMVDRHVRNPNEPWIMHRLGRVESEERHGLHMNRLIRVVYRTVVRRTLRSYGVRDPRFR